MMAESISADKTEANDHDSDESGDSDESDDSDESGDSDSPNNLIDSDDSEDSDEEDPKECRCSITQDEEKDIEKFINAKLEEAKIELEKTVSLYWLLQDIELHNLSAIQRKRQNNIISSMFRYVIYLEDLKRRRGRCKFCVQSENAAN